MKCPKCGREIEDGSLFCKYCFADIRIVPTYDNTVEQKISETMDKVKDDIDLETYREERFQKKEAERRRKEKRQRIILFCISAALAAVVLFVVLAVVRQRSSPAFFIGQAYEYANREDYSTAADMITQAQQLEEDTDPQLSLQKAEYLEKAGREEEALATAKLVVEAEDPDSETVVNAYGIMIDIYAQNGEYDKITSMLNESGNEKIQEVYSQYLVFTPDIQPDSGRYDDDVDVTMDVRGPGSVFYTLDGSKPTTSSLLYTGEVHLSRGNYTLKAIYINPFGSSSEVVTRTYQIG